MSKLEHARRALVFNIEASGDASEAINDVLRVSIKESRSQQYTRGKSRTLPKPFLSSSRLAGGTLDWILE